MPARPIHALIITGLVLASAVACGQEPGPSVVHAYGEPIDPPARPDDATCRERIVAEPVVAQRIRAELRTYGLSADPAAVQAAAADPASRIDLLGIPVRAPEMDALNRSGIAIDPDTGLSMWVHAGATERFGGIWIDPPGGHHLVVAVVDAAPATLELARCLETAGTSYVWATISLADGQALADRIGGDMQALRASGIEVNMVDYRETEGVVVVGVSHPSAQLEGQFLDRYGGPLRLEEAGPVIPN